MFQLSKAAEYNALLEYHKKKRCRGFSTWYFQTLKVKCMS